LDYEDKQHILVITGMEDEARLIRQPFTQVIISAARHDLLRKRLTAVNAEQISMVISFGVAGGLNPDIPDGALMAANRIASNDNAWDMDLTPFSTILEKFRDNRSLNFSIGTFAAGNDWVGTSPEVKQEFRDTTGADAIDTESHIAAEFAVRNDLPLLVLRAISDSALKTMPAATLIPLKDNGTPRLGKILMSVLAQPRQLPLLVASGMAYRHSLASLRTALSLTDLAQMNQKNPCNIR
jgi:hypothetical protein